METSVSAGPRADTAIIDMIDAPLVKVEHTVETNPSGNKYICSECGSALLTSHSLQQHFRKLHIESRLTCPETGCRETFKNPARYYQHLEHIHSRRSLKCSYTRCQFRFKNYNDLYEHLSSHYRFTSRKDPARCPYRRCTRHFQIQGDLDKHLATHLRLASHKATAVAGIMVERFPPNEIIDSPFKPNPAGQMAGNIEIAEDGTVFIPEENLDAAETSTVKSSAGNVVPSEEKMAIGYVLGIPSSQQFPLSSESNDYPELLALDASERPSHDSTFDKAYAVGNPIDQADGRQMLQLAITLLEMDGIVSPDELIDLWTTFLDYEQRVVALRQLAETNWLQNLEVVVRTLRMSGLGALTEAWADFKFQLYHVPHGVGGTQSAAEIIRSILLHCSTLENLRDRGYQKAINAGIHVPDLLYLPSKLPDFPADTPVIYLLGALEERVRCRKAHPEWLQFTKIIVLQEMGKYLLDLKRVIKAMYPIQQDAEILESQFDPVW